MIKPRKRLPEREKNEKWAIQNIDYYEQHANYINSSSMLTTNENKLSFEDLYLAAEGKLNEDDYSYILKPFANNQPNRSYPAKLFNYGAVIPSNIDLFLGEFRKKGLKKEVVVKSSDGFNRMTESKQQVINETAQSIFFQYALGKIPPDQINEETQQQIMQQAISMFDRTWKDDRAIEGESILDYLLQDKNAKEEFVTMFYDTLVTGRVFTYKDVIHEDIVYERVPVTEIGFVSSPEIKYLEDAEAVVRRRYMTVTDVVDSFYDVLTPEEITRLESNTNATMLSNFDVEINQSKKYPGDPVQDGQVRADSIIEVLHVQWKCFREVIKLTYPDPFTGEMRTRYVDTSYKVNNESGEEGQRMWVSDVYEGYRIDNDIYKDMGPVDIVRKKLDSPSGGKLSYNGIITRGLSMVEKLQPFEHLYNFIMYKINLLIGKNKDKFTLIPKGMVEADEDMDVFDFLYSIDATGIGFYDETNDAAKHAIQYLKVHDQSMNQHISFMIQFLQEIKRQAEEKVGITRQRRGNISPSEGKAVSEYAMEQSFTISEDLFATFYDFQEKELQGLLDIAKYAYINGKKGSYINNENQITYFNLNPQSILNSEIGVFVVNSGKDISKFEQLQSYAQAFAQNAMKPSLVAEIVNSENFRGLLSKLRDEEERMEEMQQQQQQAEQEMNAAIAEQQNAIKQGEMQLKQYEIDQQIAQKDRSDQIKLQIALINSETSLSTTLAGMEGTEDLNDNNILDIEEQRLKREEMLSELSLKSRELINKERDIENKKNIEKEKIDVKREELKSKEKIEKLKAATALKNKVAGEK